MASNLVWVAHVDGAPVEIFDNQRLAIESGKPILLWLYADAVARIRRAVFVRDKWACTHCGNPVTKDTGHMHEREWRGRGGNISLENSTTLCYDCHLNDPVAGHGNRKPKFTTS